MKKNLILVVAIIATLIGFNACSSNAKKQSVNTQSQIDSIARIKADSILKAKSDSLAKVSEEVESETSSQDDIADEDNDYFTGVGTYTATEKQMRGGNGDQECFVTHTLTCYKDGTATWKEECRGAYNVTEVFEGELKYHVESYHDKIYRWYVFDGYYYDVKKYVRTQIIDTEGNVYNGTKVENLASGSPTLKLRK